MKRMNKAFVLFLAMTLLVLPALSACGNASAAVSFEKESVSTKVFQYLCSMKKTDYLYEAYGVTSSTISSSQLQDNPSIWSATAEDGTTVADTLKSEVLDEVKLFLYLSDYAKEQGYVLGSAEKKMVRDEFDKILINYGSKAEFNRAMKQYGVNYDAILEYNYLQALAYQGLELLFGASGSMKISDGAVEKYFKNNYATASCIFINTKTKTYSNGKVVGLPEEEKAAKEKLATEIFDRAKAGEDFAFLALTYSDQAITEEDARAGYTFEKGGFVNAEAEKAVFEMKNGQISRVDTDGGVYILCRKPLNESGFEEAKSAIRSQLEDVKKYALVSEVEDKYKLNTDFLNELNIASIPHVV